MTKLTVLDLYFLDARGKLIEIAAFLDRVERAPGDADFRLAALEKALQELDRAGGNRAERTLLALSDPSTEPIPEAHTKGAVGAYGGGA
jgi:hypothetical protein